MATKQCKTCKIEFDEKYVNCASCRQKRTDYMKSYYTPKTPKSYTKDCKLCGETFTTGNVKNSHQIKYCDNCNYNTAYSRSEKGRAYQKAWYLKNKPPAAKPIETECPTCKTVFITKKKCKGYGSYKKYCNPRCRPDKVKARELREKQRREGKDCQWCGKHISFENATDKELKLFKNKKFCSSACMTANRMSNPMNRLAAQYRNAIGYVLRNTSAFSRAEVQGTKMLERISKLDFSLEELTTHIESLFKGGMSWSNYGEWQLDHIRPVSSFNYTTTDCADFKKCWALENLQPLWARDNMSKGNKWDGEINA